MSEVKFTDVSNEKKTPENVSSRKTPANCLYRGATRACFIPVRRSTSIISPSVLRHLTRCVSTLAGFRIPVPHPNYTLVNHKDVRRAEHHP